VFRLKPNLNFFGLPFLLDRHKSHAKNNNLVDYAGDNGIEILSL